MKVYFYTNFAKKENSTKRPVTEGTGAATQYEVEGNLKEPCSVLFPVLSLQTNFAGQNIPPIAGYAYIPKFYRYYFVKDWTWTDGTWTVQLSVDVLASWKLIIGQESEYILRTDSAGAAYNGEISDTAYPATTDISTSIYENASPFSPDAIDSGCYIVGIISGNRDDAVGAITYYIMDSTEFGYLKEALLSDDNLDTMGITSGGQQVVQDISKEVLKTLYNPYQYIASCTWFPIDPSDITDSEVVTQIDIGWWTYNLGGAILQCTSINIEENNISIPVHPQAATRGSYLNYMPYTRRCLYGRFGSLPLDAAFFESGDNVQISYRVDLITGQCRATFYRIRNMAMDFINQKEFVLGVPIQLAQIGTDYLGTAATAISATAGTIGQALRLDVGGAIATAATGIYNTIQAAMPQLETNGSNGTFLGPSNTTKLITICYNIVDEDITHKGRPLCEIRRIDTLSGFIMCAEGDMDLDVYEEERTAIRNYLTTGFFWE